MILQFMRRTLGVDPEQQLIAARFKEAMSSTEQVDRQLEDMSESREFMLTSVRAKMGALEDAHESSRTPLDSVPDVQAG